MKNKIFTAICAALCVLLLIGCSVTVPSAQPTDMPQATSQPASTLAPTFTPIPSPVGYSLITPQRAYETMSEAVLLDVRTAEEYEQGHIPGAYLLPVEELSARAQAELPKEKTYYIYCRTGRRSAIAAQTLVGMGYTKIFDLGGIVNWPFETQTGPFVATDLTAAQPSFEPAQLVGDGEVIPDDEDVELPDLCGINGEDCE